MMEYETKQILLENAYESWKTAIRYADYLAQGYATLYIKKTFISSLHNAIELFFKQIMLNNNDHRVARVRQLDKDGEPLKSYYNSTDLNNYFSSIPFEIRRKFFSIEFKEFFDRKCNPIALYVLENDGFIEQLRLLNKLRNDETHFFITENDFLSDQEFESLYNLIICLFSAFKRAYLFPSFEGFLQSYWNSWFEVTDTPFSMQPLQNFHFMDAIKKNELACWIKSISSTTQLSGFCNTPEMWYAVFLMKDEEKFKNEETKELLYACIKTLKKYNLFEFHYYGDWNCENEIKYCDLDAAVEKCPTMITRYNLKF